MALKIHTSAESFYPSDGTIKNYEKAQANKKEILKF